MTTRRLPAALLTGILLTGCAIGSSSADTASPRGSKAALDGKTFTVATVTENGAARPAAGKSPITIGFQNGRVTAYAGCNHLTGTATVEGNQLKVGELGATMIACPPDLQKQDEWLGGFLTGGPTVGGTAAAPVLTSGTTEVTLTEQPAPKPAPALAGTAWAVTSLVSGETVGSVPAGTKATLSFSNDGQVSGVDGCNGFTAPYTQKGGAVAFGSLISTRRACQGPQDQLEKAVLGVLDGTVIATDNGGELQLTHPSGKALVLKRT